MFLLSLQSGSNGNCVYVESRGVKLLFDAGISGMQAQTRLASHGIEISSVDALLVSHEHNDHVRCAGVFHRKFKLPLYATQKTLEAAARGRSLGVLRDVRSFVAGDTLSFGPVTVETIRTPHDSVDGVAFIVDDGAQRLGILTDLGHVFNELREVVRTLDAVLIESNYDPLMLENGPYPWHLQQRIRGPGGHLSNDDAAELLATSGAGRLRWACLGHLSEENNCPRVALSTHRAACGTKLPLHVAHRYQAGEVLEV